MRRYIMILSAVLLFGSRSVATQMPASGSNLACLAFFQSTFRTLICALSRQIVEPFRGTLLFAPQADGGGDGGGDGGSGGDGGGGTGEGGDGSGGSGSDGGAGNGGGDSGGDGGETGGNADGSSADNGTVGDLGNNGDAITSDPSAVNDQTTDPADENAAISPTAPTATLDTAQTAPNFGPGSPGSGDITPARSLARPGSAFLRESPGAPSGGAGSDVGINAVIVSGAPTPWESIGKVAEVNNVFVTGGIIALGGAELAKFSSGISVGAADNPPKWLKFKPDLRYLNGSVFPPVVPNVIDIRTISYTEEAIENPHN